MPGVAAWSRRSGWRSPLAIVVLLGLVGVVAIAATGRAPARGESTPSGHPPTLIVDYLSTVAVLFVPIGVVLVVFAAFLRRAQRGNPRKQSAKQRSVAGFVVLAVVVAGLYFYTTNHYRNRASEDSTPTPAAKSAGKTKPPAAKAEPDDYVPQFRWLPVLVLGSLVVVFGGAAGALVLRRRRGELPQRPVAEVLSEVLGETLDDLRTEADPRRAVIRAYARLERMLAAHGVPREAFEAPLEYLARVLDLVQVSAHSIRRLTALFEQARFSEHEIDARMKEDAIDALAGVRTELEAAT